MKRIGCRLRQTACVAALAFTGLWAAGCVSGTTGHSANSSPRSTNPVVTAAKHVSMCFVTPEKASALLGATVSVVKHTPTVCEYTDGPVQSPTMIQVAMFSSWKALNPSGFVPLTRDHSIRALGGFLHAYSETVHQGSELQGDAFASLPGGKWLNVFVSEAAMSGSNLQTVAEDVLRFSMQGFATKSGAPPSGPSSTGSPGNAGGASNLISGKPTDPDLRARCWISGTNDLGGPTFSVLLHNPSGEIADVFTVTVRFEQRAPYTEYSPEMFIGGQWVSPAILAIKPGENGQLKGSDYTTNGGFIATKCTVVRYN